MSDYDEIALDMAADEADDFNYATDDCDHCTGGDEHGITATGPLGPLYCACASGQGAAPDDCQCGPEEADA